MARPKKDNAEFFPHMVNMRNDDRVKAIRRKFKLQGYAIWNMLIEYLASRNHFKFEYNEFTLELMAGDFDAEVKDIQELIAYCFTLDLLQLDSGWVRCKTLEKLLEPLLSKRKRDRNGVIASENPQSKVKKSKGDRYIAVGSGGLFVSVKAKLAGELPKRVFDLDKFFEMTGQIDQLKKSKLTKFRAFIEANPGRVFNDDDHVYSSYVKFCRENPSAVARAPDNEFAEPEYQKTQLTPEAWMDKYKHEIKNNPEFKKHFKL
jgi:hypothetical protein